MRLAFPKLYAILDAELAQASELTIAETLIESGVTLIQYRNKQICSRSLFHLSRELVTLGRARGVRVVVNDRPDVAAMVGAGGVHVGQKDLPVEAARAVCGQECWVGVSTHNMEQVREAATTSADYIAVGPIFATATKKNADPVVGLELIQQARKLARKPIVAIGGITVERAADVFKAGADCIAVARDLLAAADPAARARQYLQAAIQAAERN